MASSMPIPNISSTRIQWMWNANMNPFSSNEPAEWRRYSDVENMIIEDAFTSGETHAMFDNYHINFKRQMQIYNNDNYKQRLVKRVVCNSDEVPVREERFTFTPISPKRPFGDRQGWISPFIKEAAKHLKITKDQLPSKNEKMISTVVERAAFGIVEEGKLVGRQKEGEKMAKMLLERREAGMQEVWKCCAYLYSMESFLYKKINEMMRLIGDPEHEQEWQHKIPTLGPFCLLLWDNPLDDKSTPRGTILYRGAKLDEQLISSFEEDCSKKDKPTRSFQSFTSCSRNRTKAEKFGNGNVLFIMTIKHAFTVDLEPFSNYPNEEEELLYPGVCFTVDRVDFDSEKKKHLIHLTLVQQFTNDNLDLDDLDDLRDDLRDLRRLDRLDLDLRLDRLDDLRDDRRLDRLDLDLRDRRRRRLDRLDLDLRRDLLDDLLLDRDLRRLLLLDDDDDRRLDDRRRDLYRRTGGGDDWK